MKTNLYWIFLFLFTFINCKQESKHKDYAIAIHGGAGAILRKEMSAEKEKEYMSALNNALDIGEKILKEGGTAMKAVEQVIIFLEDNPLFNAGKGAVFTNKGEHELDASIMDGQTAQAGAVGGVRVIKNPIRLARLVMEKSPHVFLIARGAETFGIVNGLDTVSNDWFDTEFRKKTWIKALEAEAKDSLGKLGMKYVNADSKFGTVGCVALDLKGHLAAGTSSGGMTNKRWGRIGDAPIIGAGTYAEDGVAAVSCTGHGEYFIRNVVAYDLIARMKYGTATLAQASHEIIHEKLKSLGGDGGLIAVDHAGNIELCFNSIGMYRGWAKAGKREVKIFK
ncbi:MAG: isoaspartyl peptidase/L-asparaginase [Saprospiraceae bacterium]|nr:isoaspartyl peptidase/L-asparaginase [Saprospiraceae bacterium]MBK7809739.1 isoaspartyl peptidase/L-asparaginase [Saprospiraceae bacterium]MBK9632151.1 isoaspartyl peptidase/L-asparaginase [Saprospiraceae bacterium]